VGGENRLQSKVERIASTGYALHYPHHLQRKKTLQREEKENDNHAIQLWGSQKICDLRRRERKKEVLRQFQGTSLSTSRRFRKEDRKRGPISPGKRRAMSSSAGALVRKEGN